MEPFNTAERLATDKLHDYLKELYRLMDPADYLYKDYYEKLFRILLVKSSKHLRLHNAILTTTNVIPSDFLNLFYTRFENEKDGKERFLKWISDNGLELEELRQKFLSYHLELTPEKRLLAHEALKSKILGLNKDDKKKALKSEEIRKELHEFLLKNPRTMSWEEIEDMHYEDVAKVKFIPTTASWNTASVSPWKSKLKNKSYAERTGMTVEDVEKYSWREGSNRFDMKKQKKFMKHHIARRFTYVMDYFYAGRFAYMLAINVNTRKAFYVVPKEFRNKSKHIGVPKEFQATAKSAIDSLTKLLQQTPVKHLIMDNEAAWTSNSFKQTLEKLGITYKFVEKYTVKGTVQTTDQRRLNHSATSLVDRLIRTIRLMNFHLGNDTEIQPSVMDFLINEYNNSPHSTLSKILRKQVSPNDVHENKSLEDEVVKELYIQNLQTELQKDFKLEPGTYVRVYNEASKFDKVKPKFLSGYWQVVQSNGALVKLKQNDSEITVNRWMIQS